MIENSNWYLIVVWSVIGLDSFAEKKAQKSAKRKRQKERRKLAKEQAASSLTTSKVIETAATRKDQSLAQQPEVVEYKDPRKSRKKVEAVQESQPNASSANDPDKQEVSMREARFDVFKFGVKELKPTKPKVMFSSTKSDFKGTTILSQAMATTTLALHVVL